MHCHEALGNEYDISAPKGLLDTEHKKMKLASGPVDFSDRLKWASFHKRGRKVKKMGLRERSILLSTASRGIVRISPIWES